MVARKAAGAARLCLGKRSGLAGYSGWFRFDPTLGTGGALDLSQVCAGCRALQGEELVVTISIDGAAIRCAT